jgi:hypothetical protein
MARQVEVSVFEDRLPDLSMEGDHLGTARSRPRHRSRRLRSDTLRRIGRYGGLDPDGLANGSFAISASPEVHDCVGTETGCWYGADNERLDQVEPEKVMVVDRGYIDSNTPKVMNRLVKAGVRLGGLLNEALGG